MKMKKIILISSILAVLASLSFADTACMLRNPGWVYTREGDDLKYKTTIDAGTKIQTSYRKFVPKTINKSENKNKIEYTEIYYEGEECYTVSGFIGQGTGDVYVVKNTTAAFTTGTIASIEAKSVPVGTTVISIDNDGYSTYPGLIRVAFYDGKVFYRVRTVYMLRDDLSNSEDDYNAVILTNAAKEKDVKTSREQIALLLSEASSVARSSGIASFVEAAKAEKLGEDISKSPIEEFSGQGTITSGGANVNVRETPGTSGKLLGQIADGKTFIVTKRTAKKDRVGKEEDYWYYISTPGGEDVDGWIFGSSAKIE